MKKLSIVHLDLRGQRVVLRADFNVPLAGDEMSDDARVRAVIPTLEHCLNCGASVVLASHLARPGGRYDSQYSLKPVACTTSGNGGRLLTRRGTVTPQWGEGASDDASVLEVA